MNKSGRKPATTDAEAVGRAKSFVESLTKIGPNEACLRDVISGEPTTTFDHAPELLTYEIPHI